ARPLVADPSVPLLITEGEKKAAKACQEGLACVRLTGVWCWVKARRKGPDGRPIGRPQLLDDLAGLPLSGRDVFVVFDSDAATNGSVGRAEQGLAGALQARGARVKLVRLPAAEGGKVGLDDYLVAHGADAFRRLLEKAEPALETGGRPAVVL